MSGIATVIRRLSLRKTATTTEMAIRRLSLRRTAITIDDQLLSTATEPSHLAASPQGGRYCGNLNREIEPRRLARLFGLWAVCNQHLMRWLVLRLFADLPFSPEHLAKAIIVIHPKTFIASGHSFVASRQ